MGVTYLVNLVLIVLYLDCTAVTERPRSLATYKYKKLNPSNLSNYNTEVFAIHRLENQFNPYTAKVDKYLIPLERIINIRPCSIDV